MKIKFNSDYDLPLKNTLDLHGIEVVRSVFNDTSIYYPQVLLDEYGIIVLSVITGTF